MDAIACTLDQCPCCLCNQAVPPLCWRLAVGSQESGSEAEIKSFCTDHYHVTFPMFSKVGAGVHRASRALKARPAMPAFAQLASV